MLETDTAANINGRRCFLGLSDALISGYERGSRFTCQGCQRRCDVGLYFGPLLKEAVLALDPSISNQTDSIIQKVQTGILPRP